MGMLISWHGGITKQGTENHNNDFTKSVSSISPVSNTVINFYLVASSCYCVAKASTIVWAQIYKFGKAYSKVKEAEWLLMRNFQTNCEMVGEAGLDELDLGIIIYSGALEAVYTQFGVVLTN